MEDGFEVHLIVIYGIAKCQLVLVLVMMGKKRNFSNDNNVKMANGTIQMENCRKREESEKREERSKERKEERKWNEHTTFTFPSNAYHVCDAINKFK